MTGCKPTDTPVEYNTKFDVTNNKVPVNKEMYQRLVGKLIYLSHTRPDISYAVSVVSQFMQAPYEEHMTAAERILRYLKRTSGKGLMFRKSEKRAIEAYTDSDWAVIIDDLQSSDHQSGKDQDQDNFSHGAPYGIDIYPPTPPCSNTCESGNSGSKETESEMIPISSCVQKNHPLSNIIGDLNADVSTRKKEKVDYQN
ncbi:uncharacterized mitochondrial protein AtMg00810-like [Benincasa hispida]|uniref:uncharacterized mitochondrial protein AtMg00810-like n=1 Tax=Benincasa hispida TaxID=102211 RepID=UPI0018FFB266|nr:uncharacterized mitochondrial protein AtMg00810-like [Benincasa hispida]